MTTKRNHNKEQGGLKDRLNEDMLTQLQSKKSHLKQQEEQKKAAEYERKRQELKKQEANKSFEQLLEESELDWETFK
ncbi:YqkE family protein [Thalassobacillus sp. CUG 92003]|uniref:YqkE family protein n=1 Tax=Thalassobacillus sp. CUG 92003 TaxID=2736641 RepID=UPI0015E70469|nr:YqkE family protein [Thalassobacillus sp. CUG 92003]